MEKMKLNIQLFANTITTTIIDLPYEDQTGTKENKSAVGITAYFKAGSNETWFNKKNIYFYCKIVNPDNSETDMSPINWDGNAKARTMECSLSKGGSVSKTFYFYFVPHQADGSLKVRCYWTISTGTSQLGTITESQTTKTQVMASIPRASYPTVSSSSVAMGSSVTIYTNRASTSFTHTIRYVFGNASGTIATGVGDNTSWTPALSLAQQIPSAVSGGGTIYCDTYSNGNLIGTNSVGITLTVPASVKPTISIGTPSEANATMISLNWGVFVQGKSQLSIPITASGSQGSWITGTTTTVNGASYSGTSITTGIINSSGSVGISSTATDSRGRTASTSSSATFVAYSNPQITTATAVRCNSGGTDSDEGTYLKYSFAGSISPVSNHNGHLFRIGYRVKNTGSYSYTNVDTANYSINKSNIVLNLNLDTSKSYDIIFEANDTFTSTAITRTVDTGFDLMNFNTSGKAMAIGKVSEAGANEELFEVGIPMKVIEPIVGQLKSSRATWWMGGRTDSIVRNTAKNSGSYNPVIDVTATNGDYSFGTLGDSAFLVHTSDSDFTAQNNVVNNLQIDLSQSYYCDLNTSRSEFKFHKPVYVSGNLTANGDITSKGYISTKTSEGGVNTTIGSWNGSWCHYNTEASSGHWFNKPIYVQGDVYAGSGYNRALAYQDSVPRIAKVYWANAMGFYLYNSGQAIVMLNHDQMAIFWVSSGGTVLNKSNILGSGINASMNSNNYIYITLNGGDYFSGFAIISP